jgi:hypothetical protein
MNLASYNDASGGRYAAKFDFWREGLPSSCMGHTEQHDGIGEEKGNDERNKVRTSFDWTESNCYVLIYPTYINRSAA